MRMLRFVGLVLLIVSTTMVGQVSINDFNAVGMDTLLWKSQESPTTFSLARDAADKFEGASAIAVHANIGAVHQWGTFAQFGYTLPDTVLTPWDWAISDSIGISVKVRMKPTHPEWMVFRIHIADRSASGEAREEWIYENTTILDVNHDWIHLKIPFLDRVSTGTEAPDSTGFIIAPTNWNMTSNNKKLDRNKIVGWSLAIVTSGWDPAANLPADSIEVVFDDFKRFGVRAVPAVFFNGRDYAPEISNKWSWGGSSIALELNAGPLPKTNAIKWTQGNEWGNGWTGMGFDISPAFNIAGGWQKDSLKFQMKADPGVGALRVQFESPTAKVGKVFSPTADGAWHSYSYALRDMVPQDGTTGFDSSNVVKFGFMAEATGVAGKVLYITDLWTGSPEFDVIPPDPPTGLAGAGAGYVNLVTWNDVPNEPGVRYNVFFSDHVWTEAADSTVEDLPPYNITSAVATHPIRTPKVDANVSLYYGVVSKDKAGNESSPAILSTPITTLAKGVPTIAKTGPASFVAN
ncbi:MAG: hypothetical protein AABY75_03870, partial [Bacteroidota bacterium]